MAYESVIVNGIFIGFLYGGIAVGLSLIFGVMNLLNLAYGAFILGSLAIAQRLQSAGHLNVLELLPIVAVLGYGAGWFVYKYGGLRRVARRGLVMVVVLTFGLDLLILGIASYFFVGTGYSLVVPHFLQESWRVGGISISAGVAWSGIFAVVMGVLLDQGLKRTRAGRNIRAARLDPVMASVNGIDVNTAYARAFGLGSAVAAVSGILIGFSEPFSSATDHDYLLIAFAITIIGGLGRIYGVLIAGVIYGVGYGVLAVWRGPVWGEVLTYVLLLLLLLVRPQGLAGSTHY